MYNVQSKKYSSRRRILTVHFTILPASPCAADFYETRHTRSTHRRNHVCQSFSRSVQGLRSSDTLKIAISIDLLCRPYKSVALPCDTVIRYQRVPYSLTTITLHYTVILSTAPKCEFP